MTGADHHYLARVLRLRAGDSVVLFDGAGAECDARLERVGERSSALRIEARRKAPAARGPAITLLMGLLKGDKMDLVVQKATELGAARLVPVVTSRSVAKTDARRPRWLKIAREAARQSGRADLPELGPVTDLHEALAGAPKDALRLMFWEEARDRPLRGALPSAPPPAVVLAIGPEGGFSAEEVAVARTHGFVLVGLGARTLRAETAALAAVVLLSHALGELG